MGRLSIPDAAAEGLYGAFSLLPKEMASKRAEVLLLAIGLQESRLIHRRQLIERNGQLLPIGPAMGLLQFERGGGVKGVMEHPASRYWAHSLCEKRGVPFHQTRVWEALQRDDVLAFGFGRLLLFTDPRRLPEIGNIRAAWQYYLRNWRPGKPHIKTWPDCYESAAGWAED